jgi:hypothetical protein
MPNYDIVPKGKRHKPFQQPDKNVTSPPSQENKIMWDKAQIEQYLMGKYGCLNPDPKVRDKLANVNFHTTAKQHKAVADRLM